MTAVNVTLTMVADMATIGEELRAGRQRKGYSLLTLANAVSGKVGQIDPSTISTLETGRRPGSPKVWTALWSVLDLPWEVLYREWGLPVPSEYAQDPESAELQATFQRLQPPAKALVLAMARQADVVVNDAGLDLARHVPTEIAAAAWVEESAAGGATWADRKVAEDGEPYNTAKPIAKSIAQREPSGQPLSAERATTPEVDGGPEDAAVDVGGAGSVGGRVRGDRAVSAARRKVEKGEGTR